MLTGSGFGKPPSFVQEIMPSEETAGINVTPCAPGTISEQISTPVRGCYIGVTSNTGSHTTSTSTRCRGFFIIYVFLFLRIPFIS